MLRSPLIRVFALVSLLFAAVVTLYPLGFMLVASLREPATAAGAGDAIGFGNYASALAARPFFLYLMNSIAASLISVVVTVVVGCLAGYSLAKFKFRGAGFVWFLALTSVMIPLEAIVIPLFLQVNAFDWTNSYAGLILPTAFNVVGVFIFRQAIVAIPDDFIEAARVDGVSEPRILLKVVVPMILPTVVVVSVLTFNLIWNSYLWPLIVVSEDSLRTLPLGMAAFQRSFNTEYGQVMAVSVFGAIPTMLFFMMLQRYFLESAATTGLKG